MTYFEFMNNLIIALITHSGNQLGSDETLPVIVLPSTQASLLKSQCLFTQI